MAVGLSFLSSATKQDIAKRLGPSETTVHPCISKFFTALGYTNRGELTITAIKAGY